MFDLVMKIMLLYNFYARLRILYDCCLQFSFDTPPSFQENQDTDGVMTNDDILGDEIPRDQQEAMRQFCYQSLKLPPGVGMLKLYISLVVAGFHFLFVNIY